MFKKNKDKTAVKTDTAKNFDLHTTSERSAEKRSNPDSFGDLSPEASSATIRESIISQGVTIKGSIASPGPIHFMGVVEGDVDAPDVSLGAAGKIYGHLKCQELSLQGHMEGEVVCEQVTASHSAHFEGSLRCRSLQLEAGAVINGDILIKKK
ncbi:MAG: polymer-forming cytoskeletal protein [Desulfuromonadales bacterium]|nr:polymer-forming cytoskeletal protein [Desulfuromonadales bacterium]